MSRKSGKAIPETKKFLSIGLVITIPFLFLNCNLVSAQVAGQAASCYCYCGISLKPPCGDDACKRACGWKAPSTGGNSPASTAAGVIAGAISSRINRAEQEKQQALQQNQQMLQSLDQMSRENSRSEDDMLRNAADQARQIDDQRRDETLSNLIGIPQTDELTLKPATNFFGIPGNPKGYLSSPVDSTVVDLRHLDPNKPITVDQNVLQGSGQDKQKQKVGTRTMDCGQARMIRDRFAAGLPVQLEAIKRTEAQLEAARKGIDEAKAESKEVLLHGAVDEARAYAQEVLTSAKALRSQIETLKGLDKAKLDMLIRTVNAIAFGGEDLVQSAKGGYEGGEALQKKVNNLSSQITTLADKLLMESGIAEKVGEELSGKVGGPYGQLLFRGAKLSIDLSFALGKGMISKDDQQTALRNISIMRSQYKRAKQRMSELDRDLGKLCKERSQARQ